MSIRINWVNPNVDFDEVRIYRTTVPLDYGNIPTSPLITLTTGETYLDTSALAETYYYYTIAVVTNGEVVLNPSTLAYQLLNSGPGPQTLQCGDWLHGYFGVVPPAELASAAELAKLAQASPQTRVFTWCKFIVKGKILFVPTDWLSEYTTWNTLYNNGLVFGINGPGPTPSDLTATNQYKVFAKGDDEFIVRLPRLQEEGNFDWVFSPILGGELLTLFISQSMKGASQPQVNILGDTMTSWNANGGGGTTFMEYNGTACGTVSSNGLPNSTRVMRTTYANWRPVLELVK